jgi:VWFA-related protein
MSPAETNRQQHAMARRRAWCLALGTAACILNPAWVPGLRAEEPPDPDLQGRYVQIEKVETVLVPTTVVDRKGRPVGGLKREHFRLTQDGKPIPIEYFATEADAPVAIAFVLDVSGSMRQEERLDAAKRAIGGFVDVLRKRDTFGLIAFADAQVTWITEFTADRAVFKKRLGVQEALGQTALFDALAACPRMVDAEIQARKAIVLFSDGLDNASQLEAQRAIQLARQASVPIYAISFIPTPVELLSKERQDGLRLLAGFARETGGRDYAVRSRDELGAAMTQIQQDLRHQYVIGFEPPPRRGAAYRRIILETTRGGLRVRCRTGYQQD